MFGISLIFVFSGLSIFYIIQYKNLKLEINQHQKDWDNLLELSEKEAFQKIHTKRLFISKMEITTSIIGILWGIFLLFYFQMR